MGVREDTMAEVTVGKCESVEEEVDEMAGMFTPRQLHFSLDSNFVAHSDFSRNRQLVFFPDNATSIQDIHALSLSPLVLKRA